MTLTRSEHSNCLAPPQASVEVGELTPLLISSAAELYPTKKSVSVIVEDGAHGGVTKPSVVSEDSAQLTVIQGTAIIVNVILGTGVFVCTGEVLRLCGSPLYALLAWVVSAAFCSLGALSYAELGTAFPESGGEYIYYRDLLARPIAFIFVWANLLLLKAGSQSIIGLIFARYLSSVLLGIPLNVVGIDGDYRVKGLAMAILVVLCVVNCRGVSTGAKVNVCLSTLTFVAIGLIGLMGAMAFWQHGASHLYVDAKRDLPTSERMSNFGLSLLLCLWAYDGWNNLNYAAGHLREPAKNMPRCIFLGMTTVTIAFLITNISYMLVLDLPTVKTSQSIAVSTAQAMFGSLGATLMAFIVSVSAAGGANSSILTGAQIFLAAGKDGLLPEWFAYVNPLTKAPSHALIAQCMWSCFLIGWGSFAPLVQCFSLVMFAFYGFSMICVIIVRQTGQSGSYKMPFYPFPPAIFLLLTLAMIVNGFFGEPTITLFGIVVILSGIPVYLYFHFTKFAKGNSGGGVEKCVDSPNSLL